MICKTTRDDLNEALSDRSGAAHLARTPAGSWRIVEDIPTVFGPRNGPIESDEVRLMIGPWTDKEDIRFFPGEGDTGEGRWAALEIPGHGHWRLPSGGDSRWYLDNPNNSADHLMYEWRQEYLLLLEDLLSAGLSALADLLRTGQAITCDFCGTPRNMGTWLCPHCEA